MPGILYGALVNLIPYKVPHLFARNKIKQRIFISSAQYVVGLIFYPLYYLLLFIAIWLLLGSVVSGFIFLISFPISGNIAFFYRRDWKKWWAAWRFRQLPEAERTALIQQREDLLQRIATL